MESAVSTAFFRIIPTSFENWPFTGPELAQVGLGSRRCLTSRQAGSSDRRRRHEVEPYSPDNPGRRYYNGGRAAVSAFLNERRRPFGKLRVPSVSRERVALQLRYITESCKYACSPLRILQSPHRSERLWSEGFVFFDSSRS